MHLAVLTCQGDNAAGSCVTCAFMGELPWQYTDGTAGLVMLNIGGAFSQPDAAPSPQWCEQLRYRWHSSCPDPGRQRDTNSRSCSCSLAEWGEVRRVSAGQKIVEIALIDDERVLHATPF